MVIEEFITTYAEQEVIKINKMNERTEEESAGDVDSLDLTPASRGNSSKFCLFNIGLGRAISGKGVKSRSPRS